MTDSRIDLLAVHSEKMDSSLIEKIDRFRSFTKGSMPRIAVLCSEKVLFNAMQQLFTQYDCADITVYGTFSSEDIVYDVMLSDAVIAVTSALTTAPVGLCRLLEEIGSLSKEVYVMVGGWESMPKDPKLAGKKAASIPEVFPYVKVAAVRNYFKQPADGFVLPEAAAQDMLRFITRDFPRLHSEQEEKLYQWLKKYVVEFHSVQRARIYDELSAVSGAQRIVSAKLDAYRVRIPHLGISVQSITDSFEKKLSEIRIAEIEYENEDDVRGFRDLVAEDKVNAESVAKRRLAARIISELRSVECTEDTAILDKGKALNADCINDLTSMHARLEKMEFVSRELVDRLGSTIGSITLIEDIAVQYDALMTAIIEAIVEKVRPLVFSFPYTHKPSAASTVIETGRKLIFDDGPDDEYDDESDDEHDESRSDGGQATETGARLLSKAESMVHSSGVEENYNEQLYAAFMEDTRLMLSTSVAQCSIMVGAVAADMKKKLDSDAYDKLRAAFADIYDLLTKISAQLENEKASYNM